MKGKRYVLAVVFLAILFFPILFIEGNGQQVDVPPPEFNIRIHEGSYSTEHRSYGTEMELDISGDVSIILPEGVPPNTECQLYLQIECDHIIEDTKSYFHFDLETKLEQFSFDGIVDEYLPGGSKIDFRITGEWEYQNNLGSGEIRPISGNITVLPYSQISYDIVNGNSRVDFKGESQKEIEITLTNEGNAEETIIITNTVEKYMDIFIEKREIALALMQSETIIIRIVPRSKDFDETIEVTFKGSYDNRRNEVEMNLYVRSVHEVEESDDMTTLFPSMMVLLGVSLLILVILFIIHRYEKKKERMRRSFKR